MKYKVDDLIKILEISINIFQVTESKKYLKETNEIIEILNEFKGKELDKIVTQNNIIKSVKFDYELLYEIILKIKSKQEIELNEKEWFYSYLDENKELELILLNDEWFKFNNLDIKYYNISDIKLIYRVLTGNEIKSKKKNDILNEIQNTIYQKKYYNDLDKKFIKENTIL